MVLCLSLHKAFLLSATFYVPQHRLNQSFSFKGCGTNDRVSSQSVKTEYVDFEWQNPQYEIFSHTKKILNVHPTVILSLSLLTENHIA